MLEDLTKELSKVVFVVFMLNMACIAQHWIIIDVGKIYCTPVQQMQSGLLLQDNAGNHMWYAAWKTLGHVMVVLGFFFSLSLKLTLSETECKQIFIIFA